MQIETFERILAAHPFFMGLAEPDLATLVGCASNVTFDAGSFLFRTGEPAERFYLVRHGTVALESFVAGRGALVVETIEPGEVLGWSWLFPPFKWHFDARATTFVRALALDGACLRAKCEKDPALGFHFMQRFAQIIVQRLEATQLQLMDVYGSQR